MSETEQECRASFATAERFYNLDTAILMAAGYAVSEADIRRLRDWARETIVPRRQNVGAPFYFGWP